MRLFATSSGTGPRIVLVHGFTQTSVSWAELAADLASDHEVLAVDVPGHGGSTAVRAGLWEAAEQIGEVGGEATYIGYSMGARLVLHLALIRPDLVARLVMIGGTAGIEDAADRAERRRTDEALAVDIERDGVDAFLGRWMALPLFAGFAANRDDLAARRANDPAGLAASLRLAGTGSQDPPLWDRLDEVAAPTLVLAGEHDAKFRALGERLASGIADATFAVVPDAGHTAHLEQPDAFLTVLRGWLAT
jgi:2-succinyl-6-hydroxy-2,4-cyclohexadiene-1-carboxylate synthase